MLVSYELAEMVLLHSHGRSTCYFNRLHDTFVIIAKCCKEFYVNSFFPRTARLSYYLPAECLSFTPDINGLRSRVMEHFFLWAFSKQLSYTLFILFFFVFGNSMLCSECIFCCTAAMVFRVIVL